MAPWNRVLEYWFGTAGEVGQQRWFWFQSGAPTDGEIRALFGDDLARARRGELDDWADTPRGRLALIVVLDQLSRNIHRDSAEAYRSDRKAQELCLTGVDHGHDRELVAIERVFFYMPLMHAEGLALQDRSVALFGALAEEVPAEQRAMVQDSLDHALRHRAVIAKFGRFPHRNAILGRESTAAETNHLAAGRWF